MWNCESTRIKILNQEVQPFALIKKTESKKFLDCVFFRTISPPCLGLCLFQTSKNFKTRSSTHFTGLIPTFFWFLAYYRVNISVGGCPYFFFVRLCFLKQLSVYAAAFLRHPSRYRPGLKLTYSRSGYTRQGQKCNFVIFVFHLLFFV